MKHPERQSTSNQLNCLQSRSVGVAISNRDKQQQIRVHLPKPKFIDQFAQSLVPGKVPPRSPLPLPKGNPLKKMISVLRQLRRSVLEASLQALSFECQL